MLSREIARYAISHVKILLYLPPLLPLIPLPHPLPSGLGENVKLNVSGGNVVLKNLKLKTDALRDLELPLKVKEGPLSLSPSLRIYLLQDTWVRLF